MSITGVGAFGSMDPSQQLLRMLSRLDSSNNTTATTNSSSTTQTSGISPDGSTMPEDQPNNALTGTSQSALSDNVLALLVRLQGQPDQTATATPPPATPTDPVQQLFSAIDTNGDGTVTQSEMEAYLEGKGGTQSQADALFSALNQGAAQGSSTGITEQQMAGDVSQAHHGRHHHRHGGGGGGEGDNSASNNITAQIFGALDANQDGSISASEFSTAFNAASATGNGSAAANGNTAAIDPSSMFAQIDTNGDGSITPTELSSFFSTLVAQVQSDFGTLGALGSMAAQSYAATANLLSGIL